MLLWAFLIIKKFQFLKKFYQLFQKYWHKHSNPQILLRPAFGAWAKKNEIGDKTLPIIGIF